MKVAIIGATAGLVRETVRLCAKAGDTLFLTGRTATKLEAIADEARAAGAHAVHTRVLDLEQTAELAVAWRAAWDTLDGVDTLLIAAGTLPDEAQCRADAAALESAMRINMVAPASLASMAAHQMATAGRGVVAVISSVAGDRGRASNYAYGASKAGLSTFLQGLGHEVAARGVRIVDVRPGPVDTPMTAHLKGKQALADPDAVGARIHEALSDGSRVVYAPGWWQPAMWVVKALPRPIFERLRL
jgi:decaprenylphospho-beta-D-erythro-pentofuranosid-2-ulose 2-reductase